MTTDIPTALEVCLASHDHTDPDVCVNAVAIRDLGATSDDGGKTISRPLTADEIKQREADAAAFAAAQAEAEAEAAAKEAKRAAVLAALAGAAGLDIADVEAALA